MRVYVHLEEFDYTIILDWNEQEAKDLDALKRAFIDRFQNEKNNIEVANDKPTTTLTVDTISLVNENGKPIQIIKNKMDIFVVVQKKCKSNTKPQSQSPHQQQQTEQNNASQNSVKTSSSSNKDSTVSGGGMSQVLQLAQQIQSQAHMLFSKKKYNASAKLFMQLMESGVDQIGCLVNLGTIYLTCKLFDKSAEYFQKAVDLKHYDYQVFLNLADSYFETKQYRKALENYNYANQVFETVVKNSGATPGDASTQTTLKEEKHKLKVRIGKTLYHMNERDAGFSLIASVLKENEQNFDALVEYGYIMMDSKGDYEEAISVLLRCLVKDQDNKRIKKLVSDLVKNPAAGPRLVIDQLTANNEGNDPNKLTNAIAPAIAWIAMIVKEHSAIDEAIVLYREALKMRPNSVSYLLNLVHTLELQIKYQEAIDETNRFLVANPSLSVRGHITAMQFHDMIKEIECIEKNATRNYRCGDQAASFTQDWDLQWIEDRAKLVPKGTSAVAQGVSSVEEKYTPEELDLLALFFTVAKILYVSGALSALPKIVSTLEDSRVNHRLHETTIRNENAYFSCIAQILTHLTKQLPLPSEASARPLYVCGESHSLSPAWQVINFGEERRTLWPVLVTGLKCWHLRHDSDFYPKANFEEAVMTIPNNEQVIFMFGEIDCREGIWLAVEKCRYKNIEHGIEVAIDIYLKKLLEVQAKKGFDIYIHPVLPVLDPTRDTVKQFNAIMVKKLNIINSKITEQKKQLKWLSFFDNLLTSDRTQLRKELELDGTHIHPQYVRFVEKALNKYSTE